MSDASVIDSRWIARTIELATENVANGGGPFGAVIVRDGAAPAPDAWLDLPAFV